MLNLLIVKYWRFICDKNIKLIMMWWSHTTLVHVAAYLLIVYGLCTLERRSVKLFVVKRQECIWLPQHMPLPARSPAASRFYCLFPCVLSHSAGSSAAVMSSFLACHFLTFYGPLCTSCVWEMIQWPVTVAPSAICATVHFVFYNCVS